MSNLHGQAKDSVLYPNFTEVRQKNPYHPNLGWPPSVAARDIANGVLSRWGPQARIYTGSGSTVLRYALMLLPRWLLDKIVSLFTGVSSVGKKSL